MDFLKSVLGEALYGQFETAVNAWNSNEANKGNLVKLANLASGEYVGKGKYDSDIRGKQEELDKANGLIGELQKTAIGNEELQGKIANYQTEVATLQELLAKEKVKSAIKVGLLSEKALDIDYLTYKIEQELKSEGKTLELDETESIKGWDDIVAGMKIKYPTQFETSTKKNIIENKLPNQQNTERVVTKEQFSKMNVEERMLLKKENEPLYKQLTGKE